MAEMKQIYTMNIWTAKTNSNTRYCQPRHSPEPENAIPAFSITVNSPLLESASSSRLKFRLETNSTVMWLL